MQILIEKSIQPDPVTSQVTETVYGCHRALYTVNIDFEGRNFL